MQTHLSSTVICALLLWISAPASPAAAQGEPDEPEGETEEDAGESDVPDGAIPVLQPPPYSPLFVAGEASVPFQEVPAELPALSEQSCNACHGTVVEHWRESGHARAWSSPLYREALAAAGEPAYCLRCHLPLLNQRAETVNGYDEGSLSKPRLEANPRFDPTLQAEGVTCAACHVRDAAVFGPRTLRPGDAPHPAFHQPDLSDPVMCAACHQLAWPGTEDKPLYDTHREWQASPWADAGVRCQDCHMPLQVGASDSRIAAHAGHRVVGSSDDAMLSRALTVLVGTVPARLQRGSELLVPIQVMNTGAGHHVPTGNPHGWIELRVRAEGVEGMDPAPRSWPLRRVVELDGEHAEGEDTRIPSGGVASFEYAITPGKKTEAPAMLTLVVELVHHRLPPELVEQFGKSEDELSRVFHQQLVSVPLR